MSAKLSGLLTAALVDPALATIGES
ncbi:MAG: hypothetical protein JWQ77_1889, partial [Jatrophihabitans sp.]|nr:hypothetical protein [Jatrophihabitans sp.]